MATLLYTKPLDTDQPLHTFFLSAQELYLTQLAQAAQLTVSHWLLSDSLKIYAISGPTTQLTALLTVLAEHHFAGLIISLDPKESATPFKRFTSYHNFTIQQ